MRLPVLPQGHEFHTSELTDDCPMRARLRQLGKTDGKAPTALTRGLIAGKAIELMVMDGEGPDTAADSAGTVIRAMLAQEGRMLTEACERDYADIIGEVSGVLPRIPELLQHIGGKNATVVGCELPIRGGIEVDGTVVPLASHIDILIRCDDGRWLIGDTKWREESPSYAYLVRQLQLPIYGHLCETGKIRFPNGQWYELGQWPRLSWLHLPHLKPVRMKQTLLDPDTGEQTQLAKGDLRPVRWANRELPTSAIYRSNAVEAVRARIRMHLAGWFPPMPSPVKCHLCECEQWCNRHDLASL